MRALRPYVAAFASRFLQMLQYRSAALAGFATQCWWGGIKVMVLAAFYAQGAHDAAAPITLADAITYTWIAQGLLALMPWTVDPEVAAAVPPRRRNFADSFRPTSLPGSFRPTWLPWLAAVARMVI